ncbi:MAG: glutamate--tRNA ligase [Candidatus Dormiibacterota bacterium]
MIGAGTQIRTRFAPSPTGALHFGSVRTALFAWLAARHAGGAFILRIEDTDQERYIPGTEALILETLSWLGLDWDEGPEVGGPHDPYIQSLRIDTYREHADLLVASGNAYWCTCTPARLAAMREAQRTRSEPTRYDRRCLARQEEVAKERASGMASVVRLRMPDGVTEWDDAVRGHVSFENSDIDDQVLLKSDGFPTYHLAVVVDDQLMEISDVIRSEEWIPSTPKHLALYRAFGWDPPRFAHVPAVLGPDHQKLSKRRGARNVLEYGELGYLPSAIVNAMALLGWSSGDEEEVFTPQQLCERFTLDRVNPAPAIFDPRRLDDLNGVHIRRMDTEALVEALEFPLIGTSKDVRRALIPMLRERMVTLADATRLCAPLLGDVVVDPAVEFPPKKVDQATAVAIVEAAINAVEHGGLDDEAALLERIRAVAESHGSKPRDAFRVLYVAILGSPTGLPVIESMAFLGRDVTLQRLRRARARLG